MERELWFNILPISLKFDQIMSRFRPICFNHRSFPQSTPGLPNLFRPPPYPLFPVGFSIFSRILSSRLFFVQRGFSCGQIKPLLKTHYVQHYSKQTDKGLSIYYVSSYNKAGSFRMLTNAYLREQGFIQKLMSYENPI